MKAYHGKPVFSGHWEEDLDGYVNIVNTMATIFEVSAQDKLRAVPFMLKGDALNYFANSSSPCTTSTEAMVE